MSVELLVNLLHKYKTPGFWIDSNIPERKINNAVRSFPLDPSVLPILGLIDCTILGSCEVGLVITNKGLIWKNSWTTKSVKSLLSWGELSERKNIIRVDKHCVNFGDGILFGMAGSSMSRKDASHLFCSLAELYESLQVEPWTNEMVLEEVEKEREEIGLFFHNLKKNRIPTSEDEAVENFIWDLLMSVTKTINNRINLENCTSPQDEISMAFNPTHKGVAAEQTDGYIELKIAGVKLLDVLADQTMRFQDNKIFTAITDRMPKKELYY